MYDLSGKVALITGAARGQGRSHALALAEAGADLVLVDICRPIETCNYPLADPADLAATVALVEERGRTAISAEVDVRDGARLDAVVADAVGSLGRLDIVLANAAISPLGHDLGLRTYTDVLATVYNGVVNTIGAAVPYLQAGASIVVTGSTAALRATTSEGVSAGGLGGAAYAVGKKALVPLVDDLAYHLAPRWIRVNAVHPSNTDTTLLHNDGMYRTFRPDLEAPTRQDAEPAFATMHRMPMPYNAPADITAAVMYLASDAARHVTGQHLAIDGGGLLMGR